MGHGSNPDAQRGSALNDDQLRSLANNVYDQVCRTDFTRPGFALVNVPTASDSFQLRRFMVALKQHLDAIHRQRAGKALVFLSMGRFDQQETTMPHRDGGPEESILMLGYEPTPIRGHLFIFDDTHYAHDWRIELSQVPPPFDPLVTETEPMCEDYVTTVEGLDPHGYQVLLINNSSVPYREGESRLLGVMHHAVIEKKSADSQRIVNSIMLAATDAGGLEPVTSEQRQEFLTTSKIA